VKGLKVFLLYLLICVTILFSLAGCTSHQSIRFESAPVTESSTVIKGTLYRPDGNGFSPAVIVLHGCGGVDYHHRKWAEQLVEWGYVALIVDYFSPRGVD
jgi:dienelactone hydrolase